MQRRAKVYGDQSPYALIDKATLGRYYAIRGLHNAAVAIWEPTLVAMRVTLGLDNEGTIRVCADLATAYNLQGRHEDAGKLGDESLALSVRYLGASHSMTIFIMNNHSVTLRDLGRRQSAVDLLTRCVATSEEMLGPSHKDTVARRTVVGQWRAEIEMEQDRRSVVES